MNKTKKYAFLIAVVMLCIVIEFTLSQAKGMINIMPEYKSETIKLPDRTVIHPLKKPYLKEGRSGVIKTAR